MKLLTRLSPRGFVTCTITSRTRHRHALDREQFSEFFLEFYPRAGESTIDSYFNHDLVYITRDPIDGEIVSVSSWSFLESSKCRVIICPLMLSRPCARGIGMPQLHGLASILRFYLRHPLQKPYLFFTCETYHSYLRVARMLPKFWPRYDLKTPLREIGIIASIGAECYGASWNDELGVMIANTPMVDEVVRVPRQLLDDPNIRFFIERNPNYSRGDCLGVLAPIDHATIICALKRLGAQRLALKANKRRTP